MRTGLPSTATANALSGGPPTRFTAACACLVLSVSQPLQPESRLQDDRRLRKQRYTSHCLAAANAFRSAPLTVRSIRWTPRTAWQLNGFIVVRTPTSANIYAPASSSYTYPLSVMSLEDGIEQTNISGIIGANYSVGTTSPINIQFHVKGPAHPTTDEFCDRFLLRYTRRLEIQTQLLATAAAPTRHGPL